MIASFVMGAPAWRLSPDRTLGWCGSSWQGIIVDDMNDGHELIDLAEGRRYRFRLLPGRPPRFIRQFLAGAILRKHGGASILDTADLSVALALSRHLAEVARLIVGPQGRQVAGWLYDEQGRFRQRILS